MVAALLPCVQLLKQVLVWRHQIPQQILVTEDVRNTDNDADNLEDQGSVSEVSNSASNVETESLHPDNDMDKFSE